MAEVFGNADAQASAESSTGSSRRCTPESRQMESDLQHLPWAQFRSIVQAIPKLKANIDAFGPSGWQFVQANYTRYPWKKSIDKLDDVQKIRLLEMIQTAKGSDLLKCR